MKTINLTINEWYNFKAIAKFKFQWDKTGDDIAITADSNQLELLGY